MAGERTTGVIVCIAVRIGTGLLESSRVVLGPHIALASLRCAVRSPTTVLIGVELHAGAHTGDGRRTAFDCQLARAYSIEISMATSRIAVVFAISGFLEPTGRYHSDG